MTALPIIIAVVIVIIGALARPAKIEESPSTFGETAQQPSTQKNAILPSSPTPSLTSSIPTPTPSPGTTPGSGQAQSISTFQYPNSTVKNSDANSLILESTNNADEITDWYKEKIKSFGMKAKSFVTTKTNGNVKNVLVGANGETEIRVEITRKAGDSATKIVVTIQTS